MSTRDYIYAPAAISGSTTQNFDFPIFPKPYRIIGMSAAVSTDATVLSRNPQLWLMDPNGPTRLGSWSCQGTDGTGTVRPSASTIVLMSWTPAPVASPKVSLLGGSTFAAETGIPADLIVWPSMRARYRLDNCAIADITTGLVLIIDREPWRPGFYHPAAPTLKGRKKRATANPSATESPDFEG